MGCYRLSAHTCARIPIINFFILIVNPSMPGSCCFRFLTVCLDFYCFLRLLITLLLIFYHFIIGFLSFHYLFLTAFLPLLYLYNLRYYIFSVFPTVLSILRMSILRMSLPIRLQIGYNHGILSINRRSYDQIDCNRH